MAKYVTNKKAGVMQLFDCPNGYVPKGTVKCGSLIVAGTIPEGNVFDVAEFKQMPDSTGTLRSAGHILSYVNFSNGDAYIWADDLKLPDEKGSGKKDDAKGQTPDRTGIYVAVAVGSAFVFAMIGMYLVKDYRNGIKYNGVIGKIQKAIAH